MSDARDEWDEAERAARQALLSHADTAELASARFEAITGSFSNYAWRASASGTQNFVRLARAGTEALGANLKAEADILHLVSDAGLAPAVLRCDPQRRLLVTRWIEPRPCGPDIAHPESRQLVAAAMARLHRLRVPRELRGVNFAVQSRLLEAALPASASSVELAADAEAVFARLAHSRCVPALCHHDVHEQNVVIDSAHRLWLVDWEYAGLGDPVFDLASFASQCDLSPEATRSLCSDYALAGGQVEQGRLELARWAFDYVQWLWYRGLQATAGAGPAHAEASRRSNRLHLRLVGRASAVLRCNNP